MREFVFDIDYPEGSAPGQKLFEVATPPDTVGVGGCIAPDEFWRIERYNGSLDAVGTVDESRFESLLGVESIGKTTCDGTVHAELLEHSAKRCEVYYHLKGVGDCASVQTLAVEYLGTDVLFELEREGTRDTWSILMPSDDSVGLLYDAIQARMRPGLEFTFDHVGQASDRRIDLFAKRNLPEEQRGALVAAVEHGYYETPRQITLDELATEVGVPRSTLSYRLRSAESKLAKAFALDTGAGEPQSFPQTTEQ